MSSPPLGADGLPPGIELFVPPPIDFDPLEEEDEVLLKHGFPRRPPSSSVEELIQWKNLCSSVGLYVTPSFEAAVKGDSQPKSETKTNWSGARVDASEGYKFFKVEGSWTVSRPHPPNKAWESDKVWLPGRFKAGSWVGIGGHAGSHVVQAGVAHRCTTSYHQDTVYETLAWFEWYPEFQWFVKGFQVASGDLVKVEVEATTNNKKSAYFRFFNLSAGTRTGFLYKPTDSEAEAVNGNCAEWIVEGHAGGDGMSYLGATFFFDCLASEKKPESKTGETTDTKTRDLDGATFLTMEQNGEVFSAGVPKYSNNAVLGVMAERRVNTLWVRTKKRRDSGTK